MSIAYPLIAQRLFNAPLMLDATKAGVIGATFAPRVYGYAQQPKKNERDRFVKEERPRGRFGPLEEWRLANQSYGLPYLFHMETGIAVIEIEGSLAHRQHHLGESSGVMGYDGIGAQLQAALEETKVRGIILDIDSPGGEVSGAYDLADRIFEAREIKPIIAIADELAASAAYLIGSAADELFLATEASQVGSIGTVLIHFDWSKRFEDIGVKPTIIKAGAHKAEGNPYEELPAEVAARLQEQVDHLWDLFINAVATQRDMSAERVRATQAALFTGTSAVDAGLADGVLSPRRLFEVFAETIKDKPAAAPAA